MKQTDKILTVSALTQYIKRKFDVDPYLQEVVVIGEISNFNAKATRHRYFSLKDDQSKINAVMFQSSYKQLKFQPQEGMKVIVKGRISLYPPSGAYQITITSMQPDGIGALYQAYEQLKEKLMQEGVFSAKQQALPKYPKNIAVITSPSGAVIRDILTTIKRRYPIVQVVVFPVQVQGKKSAPEIVSAFQAIENASLSFDTVIIGRGGGSIEDLWSFNEESVARAILSCSIPVISSVGHETDTTIADFVSDVRAATPTAAAELAVPVMADIYQKINQNTYRMHLSIQQRINFQKKRLEHRRQSYVLKNPERLYQVYAQKLDDLSYKLQREQLMIMRHFEQRWSLAQQQLSYFSPLNHIHKNQVGRSQLERTLHTAMRNYMHRQAQEFVKKVKVLNALSPLSIIERGFTMIEYDHRYVSSIGSLEVGKNITVHMKDGTVKSEILNIDSINIKEEFDGND